MSLTAQLVDLIENKSIKNGDLKAATWFFLDAISNISAGLNTDQGRILRNWFLEENPDTSRKVLFMGSLMHILEMDDLHRRSIVHPGCVVIPVVIAIGMRLGSSGRLMLEAAIKGFEACTRIGNSVGPAHYKIWHNTATCGTFGAAYAAGTLMGLNSYELCNALGNAGTQSSGFWEFVENGSMSKHLHAGRAGQSGLISAELAKHGFSGSETILEGERGFYAACCPDATPEKLLDAAESKWQIHQTSIKPWPCCRHTHPAIDASIEISRKINGVFPESIAVGVTQATIDVCDNPFPKTEYEAKFSLQHCVAVAILSGRVGFDSFESEARQFALTFNRKITVHNDEKIEQRYPDAWGANIKAEMKDGSKINLYRENAKGDPEAPLSPEEMKAKATMLFTHGRIEEPSKWIEKILCFHKFNSFFSENDFDQLLNLQA